LFEVAAVSIAIILILALLYGYLNGVHGSASIVATIVSSRALGPRQALLLAALGFGLGPYVLGIAVASTIGAELVSVEATTAPVVTAALCGAITWCALTLWFKIPASISQTLIGGLLGAVWAGYGRQAILLPGLYKTLLGLFVSPLIGLLIGFMLVRLTYWLSSSATPHVNLWFKRMQVLVSFLLAVAFGANNGQIIIGVLMLALVATGLSRTFSVPSWVLAFTAITGCIGTLVGGRRLIHTLGAKFYKIRPIHGFGAQLASGMVILSAAVLGGPVSGSQVVTSAIVGAGSADRIQQVRWGMVRQILTGWLLTLPFSALVGALAYLAIERVMV
jgi:PiT family inorganic phosphate transporter